MSALDRILFDTDPTGIFGLAFVAAIALLVVGRVVWRLLRLFASLAFTLIREAWRGRRERLERERARRSRPGPNWLAADLRRARREVQP